MDLRFGYVRGESKVNRKVSGKREVGYWVVQSAESPKANEGGGLITYGCFHGCSNVLIVIACTPPKATFSRYKFAQRYFF